MRGAAMAVAMGVALGVSSSLAQETYPTEVRTITRTEATSTCIGNTSTPVCAVETLLACMTRGDPALCRQSISGSIAPEPARREKLEYRILWQLVTQSRTQVPNPLTLATVAVERMADQGADGYVFLLEQKPGGWTVDDWGPDGEIGLPILIDPNRTEIISQDGPVAIEIKSVQ